MPSSSTHSQADDSIWDFTETTYYLEGNMQQITKRLSSLRQACPDYQVQLQVQISSFQTLQKYQKKLEEEHEVYQGDKIIDKNDFFFLWQQMYNKTRRTHSSIYLQKKLYRITFIHPIQLTVFYQHFQKELTQLQREYKYLLLPYRKQLRVFLMDQHDQKISSFFTAQIIEMKKSLYIHVDNNEQIYQIVKYSKIAQNRLVKQGIFFMILSTTKQVVFYSSVIKPTYLIKDLTRKLLSYHVSLIKFPQANMDQYILCELTKLIVRELRPVIKEVNEKYGMPVQVDVQKAGILVNDMHEVFVDGISRLQRQLWSIKVLQIECRDMDGVRRILSRPQYEGIIKYQVKYRKCFIVFGKLSSPNKQRQTQLKLTIKLMKQLQQHFTGRYLLIIHMVHLYNNRERLEQQVERVLRLAAVYGLQVVTYQRVIRLDGFYKVVIEPKQLSMHYGRERAQRVVSMLWRYVSGYNGVTDQQVMSSYPLLYFPKYIKQNYFDRNNQSHQIMYNNQINMQSQNHKQYQQPLRWYDNTQVEQQQYQDEQQQYQVNEQQQHQDDDNDTLAVDYNQLYLDDQHNLSRNKQQSLPKIKAINQPNLMESSNLNSKEQQYTTNPFTSNPNNKSYHKSLPDYSLECPQTKITSQSISSPQTNIVQNIHNINQPYLRGKRSMKTQRKLQLKFNKKLKVWHIVLNPSINIDNTTAYKQMAFIGTKFTTYNHQQLILKPYSQSDHKQIQSLKPQQQTILCYTNTQKDSFLPLYLIQIVQ